MSSTLDKLNCLFHKIGYDNVTIALSMLLHDKLSDELTVVWRFLIKGDMI